MGIPCPAGARPCIGQFARSPKVPVLASSDIWNLSMRRRFCSCLGETVPFVLIRGYIPHLALLLEKTRPVLG